MSDERRQQWRQSQARHRAGEPRLRPEVALCGTPSGANRHRRLKESVCPDCRESVNARRRNQPPPTC